MKSVRLNVKLHEQLTSPQVAFLTSQEPHAVLFGPAGTAKTYTALAKGLKALQRRQYEKIVIIRSAVATRPQGFLPGDQFEKEEVYAIPYISLCNDLLPKQGYRHLEANKLIEFTTTSYLRGQTFDGCYVILDEIQNYSYHECKTALTRIGEGSSLVVCGDSGQSDLHGAEAHEHKRFIRVFSSLADVQMVEFTVDDIVRSGLIQDYYDAEAADAPVQERGYANGHANGHSALALVN